MVSIFYLIILFYYLKAVIITYFASQQFKLSKRIEKMQYSEIISSASVSKFSPDSTFYIHYEASKLHIKQSSVDIKSITTISTPSMITNAEISSNSKYVLVCMNKVSLVHVYRIQDGALVSKIQDMQGGIVTAYWVKNSLQVMVFSQYMYKVSIYDLTDKCMYYIKAPKIGSDKGFSFSSDGKFMALIEKHQCKDYLSVYYTKKWKLVNTYQLDLFDATEVIWSPNNAYLTVWDSFINYRLVVLSHMCGQVLRYEPYNFALGIKSVKYSNNSMFLAIGSYDQKIRLLNALTWKQIGQLDCSTQTINIQKINVKRQQEESKKSLVLKTVQDKFYKIPTMKITNNPETGIPTQGVSVLQFSEDDNFLACRNDHMPYTVWVWKVQNLEPVALITCINQIKSINWTKKDNNLCITSGTDKILFWSPNQSVAECTFKFQNKKLNIKNIEWSEDGQRALISDRKNEIAYAEFMPQKIYGN